jgi:hypothetical protein
MPRYRIAVQGPPTVHYMDLECWDHAVNMGQYYKAQYDDMEVLVEEIPTDLYDVEQEPAA